MPLKPLSVQPRWKARLHQWLDELLSAQPDRQLEFILGMTWMILAVTAALAPIPELQVVSLAGMAVTLGITAGHLSAPHKRVLWVWLLWIMWQVQATVGSYLQGGIWSPHVGYYFICSMSILVSIGWRSALLTMGSTLVAILGMTYLNVKGLMPPSQLNDTEWAWPVVSVAMLIIALTSLPILAFSAKVKAVRDLEKDSAELKVAEQKLLDHQSQQRQFVASVSHELRTPIHAIMGLLQTIETQDAAFPERVESSQILKRHSAILLNRINELLDFSQLQANQLTLQIKPFDLHELIRDLSTEYAAQASQAGIGWSTEIAPNVPRVVHGDVQRTQQILCIAIDNALKFTHQGGVRLDVHNGGGDVVRFTVRDTGVGISDAEVAQLFMHSTSVKEGKLREYGGTGIGLSIALSIVRLMGGQIEVQSTLGQGTELVVELPLAAPETDAIPAGTARARYPNVTGKVLIVDDSEINLVIARKLLQQRLPQVQIWEARTGAEFQHLAHEVRPHVVLLDFHLSDASGIEAAQELRQSLDVSSMAIIGLTADASHDLTQEGIRAGMCHVLYKPYQADELVANVVEAIEKTGAEHGHTKPRPESNRYE